MLHKNIRFVVGAFLMAPVWAFAQSTTGTPVATASSASLTFSALEVGRAAPPQSITITNTGDGKLTVSSVAISGAAAGDFSAMNGCRFALAKNQRCSIGMSFKPTVSGTRAATLDITTGDKKLTVSLAGSIASTAPKIALSPASLSFGSVNVGATSAVQKLTLTNSGTADFSLGPIRAGDGDLFDFQSKNSCGNTLAAGKSCDIEVTFAPRSPGDKTGSIVIAGNAIGSPATAKVTGTAVGSKFVSSSSRLSFAELATGSQSAAQSVTISNGGNAALTFSKISLTGQNAADFLQTNTCTTTLTPGASCTLSVIYKPTAEGPKMAAVAISGNFGSMPAMIGLYADGKKPMQGGLWRGTDPISGKPLVALIAENGASQYLRDDGVQYFGWTANFGGKLEGMLSVGAADGLQGTARLQGTVEAGKSITAKLTVTPKTGAAQTGDLALTFDAAYAKASSLAAVAGNFRNAAGGATLNLNASGVVFSQDATTGCVINGAVSVIDARFNAYGVKLSFTGCKGSLANLNTTTAYGLMTLDETGKTPRLTIGAQTVKPGYAISIVAERQ